MSEKKIYVGNLSYDVTTDDLKELFSDSVKVTVITDRDTDRSKGFAFVEFDNEDAFNKALELNGTDLQGRALNVNEAKPKEEKPRGGGGGRGGYSDRGRGGPGRY